jgi:hypothetical protein
VKESSPVGNLRRKSTRRRYESAAEWPAWTDEVRIELGPDPEDAQWVAEHLNDDWDSDSLPPDDLLDLLADEAEALDRLERGFFLG